MKRKSDLTMSILKIIISSVFTGVQSQSSVTVIRQSHVSHTPPRGWLLGLSQDGYIRLYFTSRSPNAGTYGK